VSEAGFVERARKRYEDILGGEAGFDREFLADWPMQETRG